MNKNNLLWGTVLLVAGVLFLLDQQKIISFNPTLLWPIFLIIAGVFILFGRNWADTDDGEGKAIAIPLGAAKEAEIKIDHGAGKIKILGAAKKENLIEGFFYALELKSDVTSPQAKLRMRSSTGDFVNGIFPWNWGGSRRKWEFSLNADIPLKLDVDSGASQLDLDLSALKVTRLDVDAGASSINLIMPAQAGYTDASVEAGASSIDITIPPGVGARIRVEAGLAAVNVDSSRFPRDGKTYTSADYGPAANKLDLRVEAGASSINIH